MSGITHSSKTLLALVTMSAALVACDKGDAGNAANDGSTTVAEQQAGKKLPNGGESSSGASDTSSGASGGGSESSKGAIDDSVITTKAKTALLADTTVKGTDISVETNNGVVSLTGTVEDNKQKQRAASIVKGMDGVKSVENKLTVQKGNSSQ